MNAWLILLDIGVTLLVFTLCMGMYFFGPRLFKNGNSVIVVVAVLILVTISRRPSWNGIWGWSETLGLIAICSVVALGARVYREIRKPKKLD